ncbi:MAG: DegV family protein [Anaerolineae bacterium]|nr:DegV family protein [Anaerolineae bacterium]
MVHIITDTTAALPETLVQQLGIPIIPQVINFGTESFLEGGLGQGDLHAPPA